MERPRVLLLWVLVFAAAAVIVWRVGFQIPEAYTLGVEQKAGAKPSPAPDPNARPGEDRADGNDPGVVADANVPPEPNQPSETPEPNRPAEPGKIDRPGKPDEHSRPTGRPGPSATREAKAREPNAPDDPNDALEAVNLKDVEVKNLVEKIAKWTGKTVIPHEEAMKQKVTIYAPAKMPRDKALAKIYSALRMKGYVAEEIEDTIFLKPIAEARLGVVPTVEPDEPLAMFENKDQIVQKFFKLTTYNPAQMSQIVQPLVGEYGHVSADETTGTLLVIDTVMNLMRVERIIQEFDVPEAEQAVTEIFEIKYGDPSEIVQMLNILLGETDPRSRRYYGRDRYGGSRPSSPRPLAGPGRKSTDSRSGAASSVVISSGEVSVVLIPEPRRKWIIGKGPAEVMEKVREWIAKLDKAEPVESQYEIVKLMYADPREVEGSVEDGFADLPGTEFLPSVLLEALPETRQVMIFGRKDLRDMVKKMILELDVPPGEYEEKVFELKHADPDQIKENIENLYSDQSQSANRYNYYYRYGRRDQNPAETVRVIAFPSMSQVTVIASAENMRKIEKQIEEWDAPLDVDAVKPRIIELHNSDPVQMAELLTRLFSEEEDMSRAFFRSYLFGAADNERKKIVGPLYGQLTFEDVPGTKKIIVISKIPQAYDVVEQLILELDRQEMAEVPHVVQLKYADPEDLAERLNAMFNEPGTTAPIRRSDRGLSEYSMDDSQGNQNQNNNNQGNQGSAGEYMPWWSRATRGRLDEEPISNVIGRVRFIPDPRSKSILVLAPPEFQDSIEKTIKQLDTPGKQVLVKAVVIEIDHTSMTSLGLQLATNPDAFGSLEENAITALGELTSLATRGSARAANTTLGADGSGTIVGGTTAVYALIDFLIKTTNAKILNQQTLWTEDNEEAMFFKGEEVAFLAGATTSASVGVTQDVDFRDVGMTLQVRPSITPENRVDMRVRVDLSQLTSQLINSQPVTSKVETETNMIVQDGETIMLGGMLFQKDSLVNRKLPLLGDLPLVGGLFQHNDSVESNNELILFVTPFVIDDAEALSEATREQIEIPKQRLNEVQGELNETRRKLEGEPVSTLTDDGHSFLRSYAQRSPSSGAGRQAVAREPVVAKR